jgi:hypothetical protein
MRGAHARAGRRHDATQHLVFPARGADTLEVEGAEIVGVPEGVASGGGRGPDELRTVGLQALEQLEYIRFFRRVAPSTVHADHYIFGHLAPLFLAELYGFQLSQRPRLLSNAVDLLLFNY